MIKDLQEGAAFSYRAPYGVNRQEIDAIAG